MTRTLVLVRHAKTQATHPGGDHERELVERGVGDAHALGRWLAEEELLPDLVLVSTAVRARQTVDHLLRGAGLEDAEVWTGRGLYERGADGVLEAVREAPESAATVWAVGHEPAISTLALALADEAVSVPAALDGVREHVPTGTAVVLLHGVGWTELGSGTARLEAVHTARG
jgi:phosphohistidine phosphatase